MDAAAFEDLEEVFLAGLAEGESVESEVALEASVPGGVGAEWEREDRAVDLRGAGVHPVGSEFAEVVAFV